MILGVTGHRLGPKVGGYDLKTRRALGALAVEALYERQPDLVVTGMAIGWDQAIAAACIALGIPFIAAVPFDGQEERWPTEARVRYRRLLEAATWVETVSDVAGDRAMLLRNEWIVDHSDRMLALWDGCVGGGTTHCIGYAQKRGVEVSNLWGRWLGADLFDRLLG